MVTKVVGALGAYSLALLVGANRFTADANNINDTKIIIILFAES